MKVNTINNTYFKSNKNTTTPRSQQQNNSINFEKEKILAQKADSINANPITSLGYKLYRTFRFLSENDTPNTDKLNIVA